MAARKVAEINQVDLKKIQLNLLEKWLPSSLQNRQDDADTVRMLQSQFVQELELQTVDMNNINV